ncbi:copper homeostasis protein CutC [Paenibacillus sp. D2_2]|uniref:copper homeostasis protein CutC n=1 Tax=Paenibacillus sp. D2_2 TaxID=3073092 RepID=UPI0028167227|nr:copper homeostasis protein CutC [Paenibacillus sp. D2_2]WMT40702.1 copper homeostasis protein CutC [Paenibacillus sp. D2_2]
MIIEVIAYTLSDALIAARNGADRLEVITAPSEGGLTPSLGLVQAIREQVDIDIRVMIRPHSRNFIYTNEDIAVMERDIAIFRSLGVSGLVTGALTPQGDIDTVALERLLSAAEDLAITFHRAIDEAADLEQAIYTLGQYPQITHILTSGGQSSVLNATDIIERLRLVAKQQGITLLPGAGLHIDALETFLRQTSVQEFHIGSAARQGGSIMNPVDADMLSTIRRIADQF